MTLFQSQLHHAASVPWTPPINRPISSTLISWVGRAGDRRGAHHIDQVSAAHLGRVQRKSGDAKSTFITLTQLINQVIPAADEYFTATGRPFRLEVEMKGDVPDYEAGVSNAAKARLGGGAKFLRTAVAGDSSMPIESGA